MKNKFKKAVTILLAIGFISGYAIGHHASKQLEGIEKEPTAYELLQRINNAE